MFPFDEDILCKAEQQQKKQHEKGQQVVGFLVRQVQNLSAKTRCFIVPEAKLQESLFRDSAENKKSTRGTFYMQPSSCVTIINN